MKNGKGRRQRGKSSKIKVAVLVLAVCVVAIGAVEVFAFSDMTMDDSSNKEQEPVTYTNPLTGETSTEEFPARPLIVSIDNVGDAIPQSWLSKADLIYEFPVEGQQTRLQAVYYSEFPDDFGPIRSTRPYFVDLAREYKAIFLAHGWSPDAKTYLMSGVVPYINAVNSDCELYRVSDKSSPHNSYISWSEVKSKIDEEGWWDEAQEIEPFGFLSGTQENEGEAVTQVSFSYSSSKCEFTYDEETGEYTRTISGQAYVDHETGENITADNVLVQKVSSTVLDSKGRLSIDMCAGGEAILFTGGVMVEGTWSREDLDSRTVLVDSEGNEMLLTPGNTWVEVTDQNCSISYQ